MNVLHERPPAHRNRQTLSPDEKLTGEEAVYEAAHREKAWQKAATGSLIPYSCAYELTEI